ncbi:MAG TPA: hypothetical protein PLK37_10745 [Terricaulis sp.]|nr:hypothetical protein [Terricaulis sp.]
MRALIAALVLAAAPIAAASPAFADGIERPRAPRPVPLIGAPEAPAPVADDRYVTLPDGFFGASSGGVGADVGSSAHSSVTVIVRGQSARASAYASARASARAGAYGRGGGCAC